MEKGIPIRLVVRMLTQLKYMVMVAFTRLGLFKSAEEAAYSGEHSPTTSSNNHNNYVLMVDGSSPALVPVPVPLITASIKKRLPVVQYSDFLERAAGGMHKQQQQQEEEEEEEDYRDVDEEGRLRCAVCWDCIEMSHQMRELSNCCHVFHRACLDRWVDEGQVTCPLCRSMLLPANTNPWVILRNAHLSSAAAAPPPTQEEQEEDQEQGQVHSSTQDQPN